MNIVALSPNAWDGQWVNRQQLLSRIGISHMVLYSSGAFATWERGSDDWRASPFSGWTTALADTLGFIARQAPTGWKGINSARVRQTECPAS